MSEERETPPKHPISIDELLKNGWHPHECQDVKLFIKNEKTMIYDVKNQQVYSVYRDMYELIDDR